MIGLKNKVIIAGLILVTFSYCAFTQSSNYVQNITASQKDNEIIIKYDLVNPNKKGYIDPKRRLKGKNFNVGLYYTVDKQNKNKVLDASGDIGPGIELGENKEIKWNLASSVYGMIGNVDISVIPEPIYPKRSISVSYITALNGMNHILSYNTAIVTLYTPFKRRNGSLITSAGISLYYEDYPEELESITGFAPVIGAGYQFNNRIFSAYILFGPYFTKLSYTSYYEFDESEMHMDLSAKLGVDIKLFDTKYFTVLLPISATQHPYFYDLMLESGLRVQF